MFNILYNLLSQDEGYLRLEASCWSGATLDTRHHPVARSKAFSATSHSSFNVKMPFNSDQSVSAAEPMETPLASSRLNTFFFLFSLGFLREASSSCFLLSLQLQGS